MRGCFGAPVDYNVHKKYSANGLLIYQFENNSVDILPFEVNLNIQGVPKKIKIFNPDVLITLLHNYFISLDSVDL